MKRIALSALTFAFLAAGCVPQTEFRGSAHFPGGAQACYSNCQAQNMEMGGFVMSGEFASSCVCRPRPVAGQTPAAAVSQGESVAADAADLAALTGVVMQKRREDEANRQQQQTTTPVGK